MFFYWIRRRPVQSVFVMVQDSAHRAKEMRSPPASFLEAWQPFTFGGVAAFAHASRGRLSIVQLVAAFFCVACLAWFFQIAWLPVLEKAIMELPQQGAIEEGVLRWGGESSVLLDHNHFLSISVDLDREKGSQTVSDVQIVLQRGGVEVTTFLGRFRFPYGGNWRLPMTRSELEPRWLAWQPAFGVLGILGATLFLLILWTFLSILYALPGRLLSALLGRDVTWSGVRRLSGAALVPGGLFFSLAFPFYGVGRLSFLGLLFIFSLHWILGWIFVLGAILRLPAASRVPPSKSPFAETPSDDSPPLRRSKNPFHKR